MKYRPGLGELARNIKLFSSFFSNFRAHIAVIIVVMIMKISIIYVV